MRVLLVENSNEICRAAEAQFKFEKHELTAVSSYIHAIGLLLAGKRYDVVLSGMFTLQGMEYYCYGYEVMVAAAQAKIPYIGLQTKFEKTQGDPLWILKDERTRAFKLWNSWVYVRHISNYHHKNWFEFFSQLIASHLKTTGIPPARRIRKTPVYN